ncbi:hypothetical protein Tco_0022002 [Tanacetum coccineum]
MTTSIILSAEDKENYLEHPIPAAPVAAHGQQVPPQSLAAHAAWVKGSKEIVALMLMTMDLDIQRNLTHLNYNMYSMGKTMNELHAMLKLHEQTLPKRDATPALHAIRVGRVQKNQKKKPHKAAKGNQRKGKAKMGNALVPVPSFAPKPKNPPTPKKDNPTKDAICHQCGEVGH